MRMKVYIRQSKQKRITENVENLYSMILLLMMTIKPYSSAQVRLPNGDKKLSKRNRINSKLRAKKPRKRLNRLSVKKKERY